jgi:large subunit ribosomal protein L23
MKTYSTLIRTITSEKSSNQQASGQYTFEVNPSATKIDVKNAIREIYGVEAANVRMMISPSKKRLIARGRLWTKRPKIKKAIVTLKDKKTIDPNKISGKKSKK